MKNLASSDKSAEHVAEVDSLVHEELRQARIPVIRLPKIQDHSEVPTTVQGVLCGWKFVRAWYYWIAEGPALPFEFADPLHEHIGQEVRVAGHCGCPKPREWYSRHDQLGVDNYYVDSQLGLYLLAEAILKSNAVADKVTVITADWLRIHIEQANKQGAGILAGGTGRVEWRRNHTATVDACTGGVVVAFDSKFVTVCTEEQLSAVLVVIGRELVGEAP